MKPVVDGRFWRGMCFALPISAAAWVAIAVAVLAIAGCQNQYTTILVGNPSTPPTEVPSISVMQSQERGGNSPSTLNPPITATVRDNTVPVSPGLLP